MATDSEIAEPHREFLTQPIEPNPVIEAYKKDVDRTLLIENLRRTSEWRTAQFLSMQAFYNEAQARLRERREKAHGAAGTNPPRSA
jgi:hypothetical protein